MTWAELFAVAVRLLKHYPEPLVVVITFVYTVISALQWFALKSANRVAQKMLLVSQRPWLDVSLRFLKGGLVSDKQLELVLVIHNYGNSPAFVMDLQAKSHVGKIGCPPTDKRDYNPSEESFPRSVLFPSTNSGEVRYVIDARLTEMEVMTLRDTRSHLRLYVCVRYRDSLGNLHVRQRGALYDVETQYFISLAEHPAYDCAD